MIHSPV
jgi:hypothetical protein